MPALSDHEFSPTILGIEGLGRPASADELAFASALSSAAHHGSIAIANDILASDFGQKAPLALLEPALRSAAEAHQADTLDRLLDARPDWSRHAPSSLAMHAAAHAGSASCAAILFNRGFPIDTPHPDNGAQPLLHAALAGCEPIAQWLLERGASPEGRLSAAEAPTTRSALHICCERGHAGLARMLLARGANPNVTSDEGHTPLMACVGFDDALLAELLSAGADPNANATGDGRASALHFAIMDGYGESLRLLLAHGADWRAPYGSEGMSPMALALNESEDECAALILHAGADPLEKLDLGNGDGARPIEELASERSMNLTANLCRCFREKSILDQESHGAQTTARPSRI